MQVNALAVPKLREGMGLPEKVGQQSRHSRTRSDTSTCSWRPLTTAATRTSGN